MTQQAAQPHDPSMTRTNEQRAAIEHVAGDLLVSAAAGSGKTTVLAERCARLVCDLPAEEGGCGVDGLLVLTFTDAAANEMRGRIARAIRKKLDSPEGSGGGGGGDRERTHWLRRQAAMVDRAGISTLHAFCARVLRQHFHEAKIDPAFEVMDEDEARLLRDEVLTDLLARWHKPGAQDSALRTQDFSTFFEAYAQGRESACRDMILAVHRMLASTADPAAYVAIARTVYAQAGRDKTVEHFCTHTVAAQLRLARLATRRACADVAQHIGPCPMLDALRCAAEHLEQALDQAAQQNLPAVRSALSENLWPARLAGSKVPGFDTIKRRTYQKLKERIDAICENYLAADPAELRTDLATLAKPLDTLLALTGDFSVAFTAAKRAANRLDFADLERLTLDLLTAPGSLAAAELRERYRYVLVDEFQDVNPLQAALLDAVRTPAHSGNPGNLFVVGDVKQSIYAFRLAEPKLFLNLEKTSPSVFLPHNFRSHPSLLTAMNAFFERLLTVEVTQIQYAQGHALQPPPANARQKSALSAPPPDPRQLAGSPVEVHLVVMDQQEESDEDTAESSDDSAGKPAAENLSAVEEEARMVAERIAELMAQAPAIRTKDGEVRPLKYRDLAILLRSMKDKAMIFARALARRGIPVHADLSTGYFDTPEVSAALALLQVLDNPQQDIPLATVLLGAYGRFSHDDIATIRLTYNRQRVPFPEAVMRYAQDGQRGAPSGDQIENRKSKIEHSPSDLARRLNEFLAKITAWRDRLRTRPLHEGLAEIFAESKILPYLAGLDAGSQRARNLQALHQWALKFAAFSRQGLHRFLRFIERLREQEADFGEAPILSEASDVVRIMSVHKSKGLEFPVVFVSGLGNLLNLANTGPVYVHRDLGIGLKVADVERNVFYHSAASRSIVDAEARSSRAEELRLLYVAMTRARDHLILTGQLAKAGRLAETRDYWKDHAAPLPEDVLLKGRTFLDWLLPALACCNLCTRWPDGPEVESPEVVIATHAAIGSASAAASPEAMQVAEDEIIRRLLAAEPLSPEAADPAVDRLIGRVTGIYPYADLARQTAVMSVSQIKKLAEKFSRDPEQEWQDPPSAALLTEPVSTDNRAGEEARLRGIATHRVLELLDLAACASAAAIRAEIDRLRAAKSLTAEDASRADIDGIIWCLTAAPAGQRLVDAAKRHTAGETSLDLRREIPFNWAAPALTLVPAARPNVPAPAATSADPADWPTIRGVIDVLLVNRAAREAEIVDYKTDSPATWQQNLPQYQLQMACYLRAASEILGFPVTRATLVFLAPRQCREIFLRNDQ